MQTLTLTGTHLFIGWLAEEDRDLYAILRNCISVETYDEQQSCVLHLFPEHAKYTAEQETALQNRWLQYCELFNLPVNQDSLKDLSNWSLKEIFDAYSGQFVRFTLDDGSTFFGRFQVLHYSHSPSDPAPPSCTTHLDLIKYPNFYVDQNALSANTEYVSVIQGQIKNIVPVMVSAS